jgi:hypothetical protein
MSDFSSINYLKEKGIWHKFTKNDIILNIKKTWPKGILDIYSDNAPDKEYRICQYIYEHACCLVGIQCTRLTDYEINDIIINGIKSGCKNELKEKIRNLPDVIPNIVKKELISHIESLNRTVINNLVYCSCGHIDFDDSLKDDEIFTQNWGGESIYNYYDHNGTETNHEKDIAIMLNSISYPCIIYIRVKSHNDMLYYPDFTRLLDNGMKNRFENLRIEMCVERQYIEVINVIKL